MVIKKQKGVAILAMLALAIIFTTTSILAGLSLNKQRVNKAKLDSKLLSEAKNLLLGYALQSQSVGDPPGILPCPDTDNDGFSNLTVGLDCVAYLGLLPYRTLGLSVERDSESGLFWYAVEPAYTRVNTGVELNSSLATSLRLNTTENIAAVIIASRGILDGQARNEAPGGNYTVSNYLEGINSDGDTTTYTSVSSATTNDLTLGITHREYWFTIEKHVLSKVSDALTQYYNTANCNELPWASTDTVSPFNSTPGEETGKVPYDQADAYGGAPGCPATLGLDTWIEEHWFDDVYYVFCGSSGADCINIMGDLAQTSNAILITPGVALAGQSRTVFSLADYYEGENAIINSLYEYRSVNQHGVTFNDQLRIVLQ